MGVTSHYPPAHSDTYVKATTKYSTNYWPYFATDPAKSVIGSHVDNAWLSENNVFVNQRFNIDLGASKRINRIYLENGHHEGGSTGYSIKNFAFQGSNDPLSLPQLDYADDTYWTNIKTGLLAAEHVAADQADPQYFSFGSPIAYRYYSLKIADNYWGSTYMGFRRAVMQAFSLSRIMMII